MFKTKKSWEEYKHKVDVEKLTSIPENEVTKLENRMFKRNKSGNNIK